MFEEWFDRRDVNTLEDSPFGCQKIITLKDVQKAHASNSGFFSVMEESHLQNIITKYVGRYLFPLSQTFLEKAHGSFFKNKQRNKNVKKKEPVNVEV